MSEEQPPPPPSPPETRSSKGEIALWASIGFVAYLMTGLLALASRSATGLVLLALPILIALYTAITRKARGFALGVFIGAGLTLLAFGMCMAIVSKL